MSPPKTSASCSVTASGRLHGVGGGEQRRCDLAGRHLPAHFHRRRARRRGESAVRRPIASRSPLPATKRSESRRPSRVGLDPQRLAGPQPVERPRRRIGAQERQRLGIVDAKAREHAADGVAAPDALLAPVARGRRGRLRRVECRDGRIRQFAQDRLHGHRLQRRIGRQGRTPRHRTSRARRRQATARRTMRASARVRVRHRLCARIRSLYAAIVEGEKPAEPRFYQTPLSRHPARMGGPPPGPPGRTLAQATNARPPCLSI